MQFNQTFSAAALACLATSVIAKDDAFSYTISIDGLVSTFVGPTTVVGYGGQTVVISNTDYFSDAVGIVSSVVQDVYGSTTFDTATMARATDTASESGSASTTSGATSAGGESNTNYVHKGLILMGIASCLMFL